MPRNRSELEGFVLGLVWQMGASTPYEVRQQMKRSPSSQWSGSAGAIYPLFLRLRKAGLVRAKVRKTGRRKGSQYELTPKGLAALRQWVGPPIPPEAVSVAHDPLRSRARFLAALPPEKQREWFASARAALDEVERRVEAWHRENAPAFGPSAEAMTRSGRIDVASRREWLRGIDA